ncbi:unnamed protein product [Protopolystoma xenopodis]|uniref:Uncharacterized protein n=1 Tax=Protopolystoma xenopodis TaxID=117903 RepID=A0A3S5BUI7_9PLAT|nr:unnamed protein product [Protopolystoma xenopodis]
MLFKLRRHPSIIPPLSLSLSLSPFPSVGCLSASEDVVSLDATTFLLRPTQDRKKTRGHEVDSIGRSLLRRG